MASNLLSRLRGRAPLPAQVVAARERLGQLAEQHPALREAAAIQSAILQAAYDRPLALATPALMPEQLAAKRAEGVPLLHGEGLAPRPAAAEDMLLRLCAAAGPRLDRPTEAQALAAALRRGQLAPAELLRQALDGEANALHGQAAELGLNGQLLGTLLRFSLFPALTQLAAELAPKPGAAAWGHGYCPVCGSWPLLAEQRGLEQLRYLRCGLCAAEWQADRLRCAFCGTRDHEQLGYLHVEGAEHERAATCEQCRGYLKVLASLAPLAPLELVVQDLATLHLDMIALERGYMAPG